MKRWKIVLPSLIATATSLPLVSLVSCGQDEPIDDTTPLCFTDVENDSKNAKVSYTLDGELSNVDIEYSLDEEGNWTDWAENQVITLEDGQKLYVRNTQNTLSNARAFLKFITSNGDVIGSGNVNSMINYADLTDFCFYYMFAGCKTLKRAPALPAETLAEHCYQNMFAECAGLTKAPILPAMQLASHCYLAMFSGCLSLKVGPELKSTNLAPHCYEQMFDNSGLTIAPKLPAEQLYESCYAYMFRECQIKQIPSLPSTHLADYCYYFMFANCYKLILVQNTLPADDLKVSCYDHMFAYCSNLITAPQINAQLKHLQTEGKCFEKMFADCPKLKIKEEQIQYNTENKRRICSFPLGAELDLYAAEMFRGCVDQPGLFVGTPEPGHSYYWVE